MLSAQDREEIALNKFALIAPVLNGQVESQSTLRTWPLNLL
ncbi:hypothetical protein MHLNE_12410 [Moorella humiferrea]